MRLTTEKILVYVGTGMTQGSIVGANPFTWDPVTKTAGYRTKSGRALWAVHVCLNLAYFCFVCVRFVQTMTSETASLLTKSTLGFAMAFYAFVPLGQVNMIKERNHIPSFINRVKRFLKSFEQPGDLPSRKTKICQAFMEYGYYSLHSHTVALTTAAFLKPDSPELLSSLWWTPESKFSLPGRFLAAATQCYILTVRFSCLLPVFYSAVFFLVSGLAVLDELANPTASKLQNDSFNYKKQVYQELEILVRESVEAGSPVLPGAKFLLILLTVSGFIGAMRTQGGAAVAFGSVGATCLILLFQMYNFFADYNWNSKKLMHIYSVRMSSRGSYGWKALKSLRALRVSIGGLYYVDKMMILTMMKIVFDSTASILMASSKS